MSNPKLMLLDEKSLGLTPIILDKLYAALRKIKETDITILFVEQNVRRIRYSPPFIKASLRCRSLSGGSVESSFGQSFRLTGREG